MHWNKGKKQSEETCRKKRENSGKRTHGMYTTKFYAVYTNAITRCNSVRNKEYKNYGGRGIKIEWKNFIEFRDDMYEGYLQHVRLYGEKNTQIERVDNNGNYCKENCRWATRKEQMRNYRNNRVIYFRGESRSLVEWSEILGIKYQTLRTRLNTQKWSVQKSLGTTPRKTSRVYAKKK